MLDVQRSNQGIFNIHNMDKQRVRYAFQFYARIVKLIQSKLVSNGLRYNDMLTNGDM